MIHATLYTCNTPSEYWNISSLYVIDVLLAVLQLLGLCEVPLRPHLAARKVRGTAVKPGNSLQTTYLGSIYVQIHITTLKTMFSMERATLQSRLWVQDDSINTLSDRLYPKELTGSTRTMQAAFCSVWNETSCVCHHPYRIDSLGCLWYM